MEPNNLLLSNEGPMSIESASYFLNFASLLAGRAELYSQPSSIVNQPENLLIIHTNTYTNPFPALVI